MLINTLQYMRFHAPCNQVSGIHTSIIVNARRLQLKTVSTNQLWLTGG